MRRFVASIVIGLAVSLLIGPSALAQPQLGTVTYNFVGTNTTTPIQNFASTDASYVAAATNGPTYVTVTGASLVNADNMLNSKSWSNSPTPVTSNYYEFGFTNSTTATSAVSVASLSFNAFTGAKGPTDFQLGYSLTGVTGSFVTIASITGVPQGTTTLETFTFSNATVGDIAPGTSIYFQIYGNNANNSGNTEFGLSSVGNNAISVPFYAPVPEPTSIVALSCVGLTALGFRFRRKKAVV